MLDAERAWLAWAHPMATDLDPEPTSQQAVQVPQLLALSACID